MTDNDIKNEDSLRVLHYEIRTYAEFYGYASLIRMTKNYVEAANKPAYINSIDLNVNNELAKALSMSPSQEDLERIFEKLSLLDTDSLLIAVESIVTDQEAASFEKMIYTGLASKLGIDITEAEDEEEQLDMPHPVNVWPNR
jgi:hypothetical protein